MAQTLKPLLMEAREKTVRTFYKSLQIISIGEYQWVNVGLRSFTQVKRLLVVAQCVTL
jgi:hypothetical protein